MEEVTFIESISLQPDDRMLRMQYADYLELGGQFKEAERQRMLARVDNLPIRCEKTGVYVLERGNLKAVFADLDTAEHFSLLLV
jgi:uncharacterized protein (TIGR02996 family)